MPSASPSPQIPWSPATVVRWNDREGFGFLAPAAGGADLFFHVTALEAGSPRPRPGDAVEFRPGVDDRGRPAALSVRHPPGPFDRLRPPPLPAGLVLAFTALVAMASVLRGWPWWLLGIYAAASLVSGVAYAVDKRRAERGERRVPEATLHMLDALGGWPGGLLVSQTLRHKTVKLSYRLVFWAIALGHWALWATVLAGGRIWAYL